MKKILILSCLFLFGCDGIGVFSHGHSKGTCIEYTESNDAEGNYIINQSCQDDLSENECLSKESNAEKWHIWISTNKTCD